MPRTSGDPALTRSTAAQRKELWERSKTLIDKFHESLEEWVKDRGSVTLEALTRSLQGNMSDPELLWATMEALQVVTSGQLKYKQQLANIDKILTSMEEEIMQAPAGLNPTDKDIYQERQILVCEKRNQQDVAIDA